MNGEMSYPAEHNAVTQTREIFSTDRTKEKSH